MKGDRGCALSVVSCLFMFLKGFKLPGLEEPLWLRSDEGTELCSPLLLSPRPSRTRAHVPHGHTCQNHPQFQGFLQGPEQQSHPQHPSFPWGGTTQLPVGQSKGRSIPRKAASLLLPFTLRMNPQGSALTLGHSKLECFGQNSNPFPLVTRGDLSSSHTLWAGGWAPALSTAWGPHTVTPGSYGQSRDRTRTRHPAPSHPGVLTAASGGQLRINHPTQPTCFHFT